MVTNRPILMSALLVLLGLALSACQPIQAPGGTVPPAPEAETTAAALNEVAVTAVDYSFDAPESVPAGWTRFTLDNQGELAHDFLLFKIEEGKTIDDVMGALEAEGPPEWAEFVGTTTAQAGRSNWFATNLTSGDYIYLSFGEEVDGLPDAARGMVGALTVTEATEPVADDAAIDADVSIEMVDFQFVISGTLEAGEQVLRLSNSGSELHEAVFFKLQEGKTIEDVQALLDQELGNESMPEDSETPEDLIAPEDVVAGEGVVDPLLLSPGVVSYTAKEFEAGTYVVICYIPSPANEMQPHFMLGMLQEITVE